MFFVLVKTFQLLRSRENWLSLPWRYLVFEHNSLQDNLLRLVQNSLLLLYLFFFIIAPTFSDADLSGASAASKIEVFEKMAAEQKGIALLKLDLSHDIKPQETIPPHIFVVLGASVSSFSFNLYRLCRLVLSGHKWILSTMKFWGQGETCFSYISRVSFHDHWIKDTLYTETFAGEKKAIVFHCFYFASFFIALKFAIGKLATQNTHECLCRENTLAKSQMMLRWWYLNISKLGCYSHQLST